MEPNIQVYDVIITKKTDTTHLKKGDVITFFSNDTRYYGATVTHRIREIIDAEKGIFRTQGDANNMVDETLTLKENILGKVLFKIPQLGRIQFFIASKGGWLISILIPTLIIISYDIVKLLKLVGKTTKKKTTKKRN